MDFDLSEATGALQDLANGFVQRLPCLLLAVVVFLLIYALAALVRGSIRALAIARSCTGQRCFH
ncbi:hypothetical protein [Polaromonas sp. CG9_12]|uniref:hypothetical protein n=1 Tax=Polaromonas sp. CG_9.11 TaxID=2787730 RepID=UPI0004DDD685|nr:hypothetical protein [Polaromonas sp. CG_9.11]MBG6075795.1 4-amino-4-deoxy-L-arabinose transferase-like glycosyltransferase [Polaromonas sp. CG_9.11]CDS51623.1 hypothetical protein [Polaromonas sp. CG9_12]